MTAYIDGLKYTNVYCRSNHPQGDKLKITLRVIRLILYDFGYQKKRSTAGVSFFSPTVTYADNTSEPAELAILPYPVFEGGKKAAIQRGAGMCVIKSAPEKEYAAAVFLKWFTSPENNLRFVSCTGYLPVTKEAFGEIMSQEIESLSNDSIKKLLQTARTMQQEYEFYIPPLFDGIDELQMEYESKLRELTADSRTSYLNKLSNSDKNTAFKSVAPAAFADFVNIDFRKSNL